MIHINLNMIFFLRKIVKRFLFQWLSPPGGRECSNYVLGFVPAGSVSSSASSSEMQSICDGCFSHQSVCSVIFLHSGMPRAVHPQFPKVDVEDFTHASLGFPSRN